MIRGHHHHGLIRQTDGLQFVEHRPQHLIGEHRLHHHALALGDLTPGVGAHDRPLRVHPAWSGQTVVAGAVAQEPVGRVGKGKVHVGKATWAQAGKFRGKGPRHQQWVHRVPVLTLATGPLVGEFLQRYIGEVSEVHSLTKRHPGIGHRRYELGGQPDRQHPIHHDGHGVPTHRRHIHRRTATSG